MNTANPSRQVTLVSEACASSKFSEAAASFAHKLDRAPQSKMNNVAVRGHADRPGEYVCETGWASPRHVCERRDLDRLIKVSSDIVLDPRKLVLAQDAPRPLHGR